MTISKSTFMSWYLFSHSKVILFLLFLVFKFISLFINWQKQSTNHPTFYFTFQNILFAEVSLETWSLWLYSPEFYLPTWPDGLGYLRRLVVKLPFLSHLLLILNRKVSYFFIFTWFNNENNLKKGINPNKHSNIFLGPFH